MKRIAKVLVSIGIILFSCTEKSKKVDVVQNIYRPQLHFTPQKNWMNDPNGMFYYKGKYHLFYQHNPFGIKWGHMSWGHAVSEDMISWTHKPIALKEENGVMIFSGSAVVDWNNTSSFGTKENPPIIAIYTGYEPERNIQQQSIAYSIDEGETWTKYEQNPVLDFGLVNFRDPKVMWYEPDQKWVMSVSLAMDRKIQFYSSKNLKEWEFMSDFGPAGSVNGIWECPDLFELKTNDESESRWILEVDVNGGSPAGGCGAQYFIGEFDGTTFTTDKLESINSKLPYIPVGKIFDNFEGDYSKWIVEGEAFGSTPIAGTLPNQNEVTGFYNKRLVNSFNNGDKTTGLMKSTNFLITDDYINFLIGGGSNIDEVGISLFVDNVKVSTTSGENSEHLYWNSWDVKAYRNKEAYIEIYDYSTGDWGHINIDHIVQSNQQAYNTSEQANWIDYGKDFYGAVSWSDIPPEDGRKLWLGWMNNWQYGTEIPTEIWRSAMSVPRYLILDKSDNKFILRQEIVEELNRHIKKTDSLSNVNVDTINEVLVEQKTSDLIFKIDASLEMKNIAEIFEFKILNNDKITYKFSFDKVTSTITVLRPQDGNVSFHKDFVSVQQLKIATKNNKLEFKILVDRSSVELFLQGGRYVFSNLIFPKDNNNVVKFESTGTHETLFDEIAIHTF